MNKLKFISSDGELEKQPATLDEVLEKIIKENIEGIQEFVSEPEKDAVVSRHHSTGQHFRNSLGLWDEKSELAKYFNSIGIFHADDMSGIIMTSLHRKLNNKDIKLQEQIEYYKKYWKDINVEKNNLVIKMKSRYFENQDS